MVAIFNLMPDHWSGKYPPGSAYATSSRHASTDKRSAATPIARMAANVGWKGRMIAPATMTAPASSKTNRVRAVAEPASSTPAVIASTLPATVRNQRSSSTDFLIRLQQHPGRRRHQHYDHHKEEAGECGNHPEDDHPYTVSSTERVRDGTLSENKHIRSGRCAPS